jgi:hypothetical protein
MEHSKYYNNAKIFLILYGDKLLEEYFNKKIDFIKHMDLRIKKLKLGQQ